MITPRRGDAVAVAPPMARHAVDRLVDAVGVVEAAAARRVAAVLFTYRCSIACRHCCFGCSAHRPAVAMSPRQCVEALGLLHATGRVVHIAGGEAMLYWDALREALRLAAGAGLAPHFIETNCSFAGSDAVVRKRFAVLAEHGVRGVLASADPFHQQFVPAARFLRVRRWAKEIFGDRNFWGPGGSDAEIRGLGNLTRRRGQLRDYVRRHPLAMVGSAQKYLARHLDSYPPDYPRLPAYSWRGAPDNRSCADQFRARSMWELHIDPYGNIQTNCGIILGNTATVTPAALLARGPARANRFARTVAEAGALGLARLAEREYGFKLPDRVAQTCELCYLARRFLRQRHPEVFGPAEVYE